MTATNMCPNFGGFRYSPSPLGVGRVSVPVLRRNSNCPAGRTCRILFHTWLESTSSATSGSYFGQLVPSVSCHIFHNKMVEIEDLALSNRPTEDGWILWFLQYSSSVKIHDISSIRGSCEVDIDDRKINFALVLRFDKEGMSITFGWWRQKW